MDRERNVGNGCVYGRGERAGEYVYLVLSPRDGVPMYAFDALEEARDVAAALEATLVEEGLAGREYRVFMVKRWGK